MMNRTYAVRYPRAKTNEGIITRGMKALFSNVCVLCVASIVVALTVKVIISLF